MALAALLSTLEGPASLSFIPDGRLESQLAPLIQEGLRDGPTACLLQPQLQAFGWEPDRGFANGRPDLRALASRLRHQCHEVCLFEFAFWRIFAHCCRDRSEVFGDPRCLHDAFDANIPAACCLSFE